MKYEDIKRLSEAEIEALYLRWRKNYAVHWGWREQIEEKSRFIPKIYGDIENDS